MKKVTKALGVLTLSAFLGFTNPAVAQSTDNGTSVSQTAGDDDDDDDSGKWGLLGLAGLLGLLGLKRRDRDDHKVHSTVNR